jgi:hypothetical protein
MSMLRIIAVALCALVFAAPANAQSRAERALNQLLTEHERIERQFDPTTRRFRACRIFRPRRWRRAASRWRRSGRAWRR